MMHNIQSYAIMQKTLFGVTLILMGLSIILMNPMALATIGFLSLVALTLHFDIFSSTRDPHLLNRANFLLQIAVILIALVKFFLLAHPRLV